MPSQYGWVEKLMFRSSGSMEINAFHTEHNAASDKLPTKLPQIVSRKSERVLLFSTSNEMCSVSCPSELDLKSISLN